MTTNELSGKRNAPFLSFMDIERKAYETVKAFDRSLLIEPRELDVELFAEQFLKLRLDYLDLSHNASILGMMVFSDSPVPVFDPEQNQPKIIKVKSGTALIEKSLLEDRLQNRTRFTIAHECAHWLLHRPKGKAQPLVCRTVGQSDQRDWLEWQADNLASALLMPAVSVHAFMKQYVKDNRQAMEQMYRMFGERYVDNKRDQIIRTVALTFGVSEKTAELRLKRLQYIKGKPVIEEQSPLSKSIDQYLTRYCGQRLCV